MLLRYATVADLDIIARLEAQCFPPEEACPREVFAERLRYFPNHFWLLFHGGTLASFADGFCTNRAELADEMYADARAHDENGAWQMIFGVNTLPEHRRRGYASRLLRMAIDDARIQRRKGVALTCKAEKIPFYESLGFVHEGESASTHGGAAWHAMRITF